MICYKQNILTLQRILTKEEGILINIDSNRLIAIMLSVFTISFIFAAIFIVGCGDEGDSPTDMVGDSDSPSDPDDDPVTVAPTPDPNEPEVPAVTFRNDILPILTDSCALVGCHTGLPPAGGLDLTDYTNFTDGGANGAAFIAGDGEGSLVVKRIDGGGMPPPGHIPLTAEQIQFFIDWIDAGAENN